MSGIHSPSHLILQVLSLFQSDDPNYPLPCRAVGLQTNFSVQKCLTLNILSSNCLKRKGRCCYLNYGKSRCCYLNNSRVLEMIFQSLGTELLNSSYFVIGLDTFKFPCG